MMRTHAGLLLLLAPVACLGDPVSGGATLSGGSGDASGGAPTDGNEAGASGMADDGSTGPGPCQDGSAAFDAAWASALGDVDIAAAALQERTDTALQQLATIYAIGSDDPLVLAAHIQSQLTSVAEGAVEISIAPRRCTDVRPSAEASAMACDPGGGHVYTCLGAARCSNGCPGAMSSDAITQCTGTCWGDCDLSVGGAACGHVCVGQCDGNCECDYTESDGSTSCHGSCDGSCEGTCWTGGSCSTDCDGVCAGFDLAIDPEAWCLSDGGPVECSGSVTACEGEMLVEGLPPACDGAVGLGTAAAATCAARPFSIQLERKAGVDGDAAGMVKHQLFEARSTIADLLGVVDHLDLLLGHPGPNICSDTPGAAHGAAHLAQQQALQQQRDALDGFVTLLGG